MRLVVLIAALLIIAGCAEQDRKHTETLSTNTAGYGGTIKLVKLDNGTRCAILINGYAGGLSCDWRAAQ